MNKTGEWGELLTVRYLRKKGYTVLTTNYHCRFGEADIICLDGKKVVIVEVKARAGKMIALPREYVTKQKQQKLALTAVSYCKAKKIAAPIRFDVAEILFEDVNNYKKYKINYLKDAFRV